MKVYEQHINLKSWAEEDRPREKLMRQGRRNLSDAELLAILIRSGTPRETAVELSKRILSTLENDLSRLAQLTVNDLSRFQGIGKSKAVTIIAALELGRRRRDEHREISSINDSKDSFNLMSRYFSDLTHEEFWVILLGRSNKLISYQLISTGGQSETIADPKIIFRVALDHGASSVILLHNHPSGNPKPGKADISLTRKLCSAGNLLDISVVDHVIFVNSGYFSFADEGLM